MYKGWILNLEIKFNNRNQVDDKLRVGYVEGLFFFI